MCSQLITEPSPSPVRDREWRCELLRSLHVPGRPLVLPNAWDVPSAQAVVAAGFPVVATTSGGVAATLGHQDHERAPRNEMLDAAARIVSGVDVPVTVDLEAGYGMDADELVSRLMEMGAAGCNLEDTDYRTGMLRDATEQADRLREVRRAASRRHYGLVINARIDTFLLDRTSSGGGLHQIDDVDEALSRAHAYVEAGADCVFPIVLWQRDALAAFMSQAPGPVNILRIPPTPSETELGELGVARLSFGHLLQADVMAFFTQRLASLRKAVPS